MKKLFALLLCFAMVAGLLAGCGSTATESAANAETDDASTVEASEVAQEPESATAEKVATVDTDTSEPASDVEASAEEPLEEAEEEEDAVFDPIAILAEVDNSTNPIQFPLEETEELTCWMSVSDRLLQDLPGGQDEIRPFMVMEEYTNVDIVWTQVTATLAATQFQLMVAGGDYTDLMINVSSMYTTGLDAAVEDDVWIDMGPYLEEYAPNYYALINASEQANAEVMTSGGRYVAMSGFSDSPAIVDNGFVVRTDFLEETGLDVPVTYDDYYEVLTAFKNMGIEEPFYLPSCGFFSNEYLIGGYGIAGKVSSMPMQSDPWYQVDGEVRFGAVQPEMKEYLTMLNQWYTEGLINQDFISVNTRDSDSDKSCTDELGIFFVEVGMGWATLKANEKTNPDWDLTPIAEPVLNEGDTVHFASESSLSDGGGVVISTACEKPELAVAWCDSWFSEFGQISANYGKEGESYEMVDGNPVYTELALTGNNLNVMYSASVIPTITYRYKLADTWDEFETSSREVWTASRDDAYSYSNNAVLTTEENEEYAAIMADIHTYMEEHLTKFITGDESLDDFDEFVENIESMDLARCIELKQAALDRYLGA